MDRGKAKMTEDDIAAEQRAQRRHYRIVVGEGLHLQPSFERGLPTPNDNSELMAQQFLDDRYITPTENAWRMFSDSRLQDTTSFAPQVSTANLWTIPASAPMPIWTANPWTIQPSAPMPMSFAPQTNIGSTTTISSSCPLPPNSVLQRMEHLSVNAPRTVQDIRSDLFVGLRDVSSQSVSLWDVPASVSSPTNSVFQTTNVTLCNVQASSNMPASSVSQQMGQLSATPQPLPIDGDQFNRIQRDKATRNTCIARALLANMVAMYHGPECLKTIAQRAHGLAGTFAFPRVFFFSSRSPKS